MAIGVTRNLGMLLLAVWLILSGLTALAHLAVPSIVFAVLVLVAGILILLGK